MTVANKATPKRKAKFLEDLSKTGNVTLSAELININKATAYKWRYADEKFAEGWENAVEEAADRLEAEARRRAVEGVSEPKFHQGDICGYIQNYSDTLLIFLLKGAKPAKYKDRTELTGKDGGPVKIEEITRTIVDPKNEA